MNDTEPDSSSSALESTVTSEDVTHRVVRGAVALGIRQVVVHSANVLGNILLARLLAPKDYGLFAIVNFFILFLGAFGGTGLAANPIREDPHPGPIIARSIYSFQQVSVLLIAVVVWALSPLAATAYHLGVPGSWVFRLTALSLVATVYMVPPQIEMERSLEFRKLAIIETVQSFCFNIVAVSLAWKGFGVLSFGVALLLRSVSGSVLANLMHRVSHAWAFDWQLAKPHLRFGVFLQAATIISLVKDSITPILVGFVVGAAGVGYLSWAAMTSSYPILALTVLQRLYLPAFAKFQQDRIRFAQFLEQIIWATNVIAAPFAVLLLVLIHPIVDLVFGAKWEIALPLFYLLWSANLFVPTATPVQNVFSAIGKAHLATLIATMWMLLTWGLGWPLALKMGTTGVALATAVVQLSNLVLFRLAQRFVPFRILRTIYLPWLAATAMGLLVFAVLQVLVPKHLISLANYILAGIIIYAGALLLFDTRRLLQARRLVNARPALP